MENKLILISNNDNNYRHGIENPEIINYVMFTPKGYEPRLCFKVQYDSDKKVDYIPVSSVERYGDWFIQGVVN